MIAAVVVAAGLGVGLALGLGGGSGSDLGTTAQLTSVRTGCQQWLQDTSAQQGTAKWCDDMAQWISTYMHRYGYGPGMMWAGPSQFRTSCEHWLRTSPPADAGTGATGATGWCDSMVSWMHTHMDRWSGQGTWGGWMGHGPMMGLGATQTAAGSAGGASSPYAG